MKMKKKDEIIIDSVMKLITPSEFSSILSIVGYKKKEYTDSIGKSRSYLHNCIIGLNDFIPIRFVDSLIKLTGERNYMLAYSRTKEMKQHKHNS